MENILPGVVHLEGTMRGKPIELAGDRGLGDGQRVEVAIRAVGERDRREAAIRNTAGALAHMAPEFFEELNEIVRGREEGV